MKYRFRKAFTVLELIFVLAVLAVLGYYLVVKLENNNFNTQLSDFSKTLVKIIYSGVTNPVTGYANGTGGTFCSTGFDYQDISAYRVNNCAELKIDVVEDDNTPVARIDGSLSKMLVFPSFTMNQGALYIDDLSTDPTKEILRIYIDLSTLTVSPKRKIYIEDYIEATIREEFSTSVHGLTGGIDRDATGLETLTGGTMDDGKILIEIKK